MADDEGRIELRAIRDDMVTIQSMDITKDADARLIVYRLAGAIRTLAYHIEQLEKHNGR